MYSVLFKDTLKESAIQVYQSESIVRQSLQTLSILMLYWFTQWHAYQSCRSCPTKLTDLSEFNVRRYWLL